MKTVNVNALAIMQDASVLTFDVYVLTIGSSTYTFKAYDVTRTRNMIWQHDQIKTSGEPTVDTLNVTVHCDRQDTIKVGDYDIPFMRYCHDGGLDGSVLELRRTYVDSETGNEYQVPLFKGRVEIASAGGLAVKLRVKSYGQGLAAPVPVRIFARQNAYAKVAGVVATLASDTNNMVIPLKPSGNVLVNSGG